MVQILQEKISGPRDEDRKPFTEVVEAVSNRESLRMSRWPISLFVVLILVGSAAYASRQFALKMPYHFSAKHPRTTVIDVEIVTSSEFEQLKKK